MAAAAETVAARAEAGEKQELLSEGSRFHRSGRCKPCAFYHTKGCLNGSACSFCHDCPPQEAQRRQKVRRQLLRPLYGHLRQGSEGSASASTASGGSRRLSHSRQSSGATTCSAEDALAPTAGELAAAAEAFLAAGSCRRLGHSRQPSGASTAGQAVDPAALAAAAEAVLGGGRGQRFTHSRQSSGASSAGQAGGHRFSHSRQSSGSSTTGSTIAEAPASEWSAPVPCQPEARGHAEQRAQPPAGQQEPAGQAPLFCGGVQYMLVPVPMAMPIPTPQEAGQAAAALRLPWLPQQACAALQGPVAERYAEPNCGGESPATAAGY